MKDEERLEEQELIMERVEKETEEAPTADLGESGILVDGKGEDVDASN